MKFNFGFLSFPLKFTYNELIVLKEINFVSKILNQFPQRNRKKGKCASMPFNSKCSSEKLCVNTIFKLFQFKCLRGF